MPILGSGVVLRQQTKDTTPATTIIIPHHHQNNHHHSLTPQLKPHSPHQTTPLTPRNSILFPTFYQHQPPPTPQDNSSYLQKTMATPTTTPTTTTVLHFRPITMSDLETVIEIENYGFTPEEAATPEAFKIRIEQIPDTFLIAEQIITTTDPDTNESTTTKRIVGFIDGPVVHKRYITDDLFDTVVPNPPTGGHQSILGIAVHPDFRKHGLGSALMNELIRVAKEAKRETITLTCRDILFNFYEKLNFKNEGVSESTHGGYVWYNMIYDLNQ